MTSRIRFLLLGILLCVAGLLPTTGSAQSGSQPFSHRSLLFENIGSPAFQEIIARIIEPGSPVVADGDLDPKGFYFRLAPRKYVIAPDGALANKAVLGTKPYVFLTAPAAAYGRSLYDIYADIGYSAEDLLAQRGVPTVALVFRYRDQVSLSLVRDGRLPADFRSFVYVPTWRNAFALFAALAGDSPPPSDPPFLNSLNLNDHERSLARYFPPEGLARIKALPYPLIRSVGGPDWEYRSLLNSKMSMNPHFLGTGKTENTLSPADTRRGLPEFVGPNRLIAELPEAVVIDMGRLEFVEMHD